ncbi:hypothetical protein AVEN_117025-1 [Araneus ventricosus]|uniref:Uncharacterized protein n=1 Tax=Araneus ventricosus TaxID=182803 RepID=A0A4Y2W6K5_ARAVE|nr:hypothetical protein AVEN_117025-1 [Araneus ventricosus]
MTRTTSKLEPLSKLPHHTSGRTFTPYVLFGMKLPRFKTNSQLNQVSSLELYDPKSETLPLGHCRNYSCAIHCNALTTKLLENSFRSPSIFVMIFRNILAIDYLFIGFERDMLKVDGNLVRVRRSGLEIMKVEMVKGSNFPFPLISFNFKIEIKFKLSLYANKQL